ncbi:MAG: ATP-binding protein [Bdellovibrionota bacterium]
MKNQKKSKSPNNSSLDLLQSEESFLQILNAIGDMVLVKGPKSKLIWANQAFCDYYGMSPSQLRGILDAPFSEPDHTQKYVIDDTWVFENKKVLSISQEPVTRHDGAVGIFHTVKSPIFDSSGNVIMTVGISRDITKQLEALKLLEEQRASATYSSKMATLGEMAGGIAHEINTPLAAIILRAEMIELHNASFEKPDAEIADHATSILGTGQRIAQIVKNLKGFSRNATNDPSNTFSVRDLVESTVSLCREKLKLNGISIEVEEPNLDLVVYGQVIQLSQALLNLLNNACDSIANIDSKWIRIQVSRFDEYLEISVTDCGKGILPEIAKKIFEPFFTTKDVGQGTGLGLSISHTILKSQGGELFYNDRNANTCFVMRLPYHKSGKSIT